MNTLLRRCLFGCVAPLVFGSSTALAQSTLGELLDAGGKQLSKEEVAALLSEASITGQDRDGQKQFQIRYKTDGTFSGTTRNPNFGRGAEGISGTWAVDATGMSCSDFGSTRLYGGARIPKSCEFWFKSADHYFVSDSDSDRSSTLRRMAFKK